MSETKMAKSQISAMAAMKAGAELEPWQYTPKPLGKHDVFMSVEYCGVCHSDIHQIDNDWGGAKYPLVPGHEATGTVLKVGSAVTKFKVGDKVGLGAQCSSCGNCEFCDIGEDPMCDHFKATYASEVEDETGKFRHFGGFGSSIVTPASHVVKVPEGYPLEYVGPLCCAGVTVYRPLKKLGTGPGKKVCIVGIGGLGHMAVQYSKAMGAETTAVSSSENKEEFAKKLGAHGFICSKNEESMKQHAKQFDLVLITISANIDFLPYVNLAKKMGTVAFVGLPTEPLKIPLSMLIQRQINITGSLIGGVPVLQDMLDFSAKHNIRPIIEVFPHSKVNEAIKKVRDNTIRFRAVLKQDLV